MTEELFLLASKDKNLEYFTMLQSYYPEVTIRGKTYDSKDVPFDIYFLETQRNSLEYQDSDESEEQSQSLEVMKTEERKILQSKSEEIIPEKNLKILEITKNESDLLDEVLETCSNQKLIRLILKTIQEKNLGLFSIVFKRLNDVSEIIFIIFEIISKGDLEMFILSLKIIRQEECLDFYELFLLETIKHGKVSMYKYLINNPKLKYSFDLDEQLEKYNFPKYK
jgi:hypothetical protein